MDDANEVFDVLDVDAACDALDEMSANVASSTALRESLDLPVMD